MAWIVALLLLILSQSSLPALAEDKPSNASTRPFVIIIEKPNCEPCVKLHEIIKPVVAKYEKSITFITLEVTDKGATEGALKKARELGVDWFLEDNAQMYPTVGVFKSKRRLLKELIGLKQQTDYENAIERALKP